MSSPASSSSEVLQRRYGNRNRGPETSSRGMWIGGAIVAIVITAISLWFTIAEESPVATVTPPTYTVLSDHEVSVSFTVERPNPAVPVQCTVEATDASKAQVGVVNVTVPATEESATQITAQVTTFARAEQAEAIENSCFAVSE